MISGSRRLAVLMAGLLLLAGCSEPVAGQAQRAADGEPLAARAAIGDLRTVDTCATVDLKAFDEFGTARAVEQNNLSACSIVVPVRSVLVRVNVGFFWQPERLKVERERERLPNGARLVQTESFFDDDCSVHVVFADDIAVQARATADGGNLPEERECEIASAGAKAFFDAVRGGAVKHWEPGSNSLARVSACGVLDGIAVGDMLGVDQQEGWMEPDEHRCGWGERWGEPPSVVVDFEVGKPDPTERATRKRIGGRLSEIIPVSVEDYTICAVISDHIRFGRGKSNEIERAAVRVMLDSGEKKACRIATRIAAKAWPKLPKP